VKIRPDSWLVCGPFRCHRHLFPSVSYLWHKQWQKSSTNTFL